MYISQVIVNAGISSRHARDTDIVSEAANSADPTELLRRNDSLRVSLLFNGSICQHYH